MVLNKQQQSPMWTFKKDKMPKFILRISYLLAGGQEERKQTSVVVKASQMGLTLPLINYFSKPHVSTLTALESPGVL